MWETSQRRCARHAGPSQSVRNLCPARSTEASLVDVAVFMFGPETALVFFFFYAAVKHLNPRYKTLLEDRGMAPPAGPGGRGAPCRRPRPPAQICFLTL